MQKIIIAAISLVYAFLLISLIYFRLDSKDRIIKVGVDGYSPPFCITDDIGDLRGFNIDIMSTLGKALGVKVVYKIIPFTSLHEALRQGKIDVVIAPFDSDMNVNKRFVEFTKPYYINNVSYLTLKSAPVHLSKKKNEVKSICVLDKSNIVNFVRANFKDARKEIYDISKNALKALNRGNCEIIVDVKSSLQYYVTKHKLKDVMTFNVPTDAKDEHIYRIAVKKEKLHLLTKLNEALDHIVQTGEMDMINNKWFSKKEDLSEFYRN